MDLQSVALAFGVPGVLGVVWLVRLEGQINVLRARLDAAEKRVDGLEIRIIDQLNRIEHKLDGKQDRA